MQTKDYYKILGVSESATSDELKQWCQSLLDSRVRSGNGFAVIRGDSYRELEDADRKRLTRRLALAIGDPVVHRSAHLNQELVTDIRDQGYRFDNSRKQSFNNSNQEAVEHTESSELEEPIRLFILSCLHPAYRGGATRLVNLHTLVGRLKEGFPEFVPRMRRPYVFDTGRGETMEAPILSFEDNGDLHFRWMRAFLENGGNQTPHWNSETDRMIEVICDSIAATRLRIELERGDIGLFNNRALMHARDAFENHPDHPTRWLLRSWFH